MYARLQTAPTRPATDDPDKLIRHRVLAYESVVR